MTVGKLCVPVIDMKDDDDERGMAVGKKLVKACEEWGCFRLLNHGIPEEVMAEMKGVARSLLDLPVEIKERNSDPDIGKGYTPPNMASPFFEGLGVYDMARPAAIHDFCLLLGASPHQREILLKYSEAIHDLAQEIGTKLMKALGLSTGDIYEEWITQFRLNKYNYSLDSVGKTGAILHSDPGFLTVLQDDELVGGLEVINKYTGELVPVDPMPNTIVINVGDVAKVWTNGRFHNVKHRVQCYKSTPRVSMALFVLGPRDAKVDTPDELVDSDHPRLYVPFDFNDYRRLRVSTNSPTGGALDLFLAN